jgi:Small, acid-soluble spore proteins, alpha/beta type.
MNDSIIKNKLESLKIKAADEIGMSRYLSGNSNEYRGDVLSRVNGANGGPIGGQMVRLMIQAQEEKMAEENKEEYNDGR